MRILLSILFLGVLISACTGNEKHNLAAQRELAAKVDSVSRPQLDTLHFMVEEKPCFAVIDKRYQNFKHQDKFPISLFVTLTTQGGDRNGHPNEQEARIHAQLESEILDSLNASSVNAYIGKTTMNGFRDLMFYIKADDQKKVTPILLGLKKKYPRIREFTFDKDPKWEAVSEFLAASSAKQRN